MTPVQLYAAIQLDDEVMNGGKPAETKEASLASRIRDLETRISDGKSGQHGKRGKRGKRDRTKGKQLHRAPQPFDGYVYDGRRPTDEYVKSQKEKRGNSYRECQFLTRRILLRSLFSLVSLEFMAIVSQVPAPGLATWLTIAINSRLTRLNKDRSRILRVRNWHSR